jgi:hypothetical protein
VKLCKLEIVDPFADNKLVGVNHVVATDNGDVSTLVYPVPPPTPTTLDKSSYTDTLAAGATGVAFLNITFSDLASVPAFVSHRLTVTQADAEGEQHTFTVTDPPTAVDRRLPIVLSAPLHGGRWLNGDMCCREIGGHRWGRTPVNGRAETTQTFAADLLQLRKDGRVYSGPIDKLSSYDDFGANVYAARGGKVVEVVRDQPDEVPGSTPTHVTALMGAGNHVIIEMEGKLYAMYAHLECNTVTVQVGDTVETGQLLGKLGNSGSTSAPHLHLQVMDQPSPLNARGYPFVFDHFGRNFKFAGSLDEEGQQTVAGQPLTLTPTPSPNVLENVMPMTFDLLDF